MNEHDPRGSDHYRSLFEGSQASLADMAARQAQALARVGRLRSAIVAVLRKNFMELSAQAEANLGGRLSEIDDEILLAYLDAFTAAASRSDQRATIGALKEAVMSLGIPLRGDEPLVWVEQIHQHRQRGGQTPSVNRVPAPVETAADDEARAPLTPRGATTNDTHVPVVNAPLPVDDYWKWDDAPALGDLFDDPEETVSFADEEPRRWDNELGSIAADTDRWTPSPIAPARAPRQGPAPAPAVAPEPGETISTIPATPTAPTSTTTQEGTDRTPTRADADDAGAEKATGRPADSADASAPRKATKRQPRQRAKAPDTVDRTTPVTPPTTSAETSAETSTATAAVEDEWSTAERKVTSSEDLSSLFDDHQPGVAASTTTNGAPSAAPMVNAPMRPELFAPTTTRRRRNARTKASPPVEEISLVDGLGPQELNDGMRTALLAAASIPRPVFTRDLIGVAGSLAMVDAWEAECRADVSNSPVRFVAPKSRHRLRGHLVAVEPSVVRPVDWWYQAVQRYRAGRLYELGVLLHRVGDEIVSFVLEEQIAVFHLNTPRGLVGMVVLLDPRPVAGSSTSSDLAGHIEKLLAERLTMIAVLTASAEPGSLENLIGHVEELARQRQWQPTAPVIAARSWEYADDRGTSAVMVLGQS